MRSAILALAGLGAAGLMGAQPALADERWKTELGVIEWETQVGDAAVFKLTANGKVARFYIENLPARAANRTGVFNGYWINTDDEKMCSAELAGPDGTKSRTWGRLEIIFTKPNFPSDWVMKTSDCAEPAMDQVITATALVGGKE